MKVLKFAALSLAAFSFVLPAFAQPQNDPTPQRVVWSVDPAHSSISFTVRHLGISRVTGEFKQYDVSLAFDPEDLSTLTASADIDINSVDTGVERRDNHLRSDDFFGVEQFPKMKFVSRRVEAIDGNTFKIVGDLTIRDVTKEVVLDAELLGTTEMRGHQLAALTATTTVNRLDYNLKWNRLTEAGGAVVGHDVTITINVEASQQ